MSRVRQSEAFENGVIRIWYTGPKGEDLDQNEPEFELYTKQVRLDAADIAAPSFLHSYNLDTSKTETVECELGFKFRLAPFSASADVYVPKLPETTALQLGWIVACNRLEFVNKYGGYGETRWELPHPLANATTGTCYPWYGCCYESANVVGQRSEGDDARSQHGGGGWSKVKVSVLCYSCPQVQWRLDLSTADGVKPGLTYVTRKQENVAWLAVKNVTTGSVYILKTLTWQWHQEYRVDVTAAVGRRTRLVVDRREHPALHNMNLIIPEETFYPPSMHYASTLRWYPLEGGADATQKNRRESVLLKVGSVSELGG